MKTLFEKMRKNRYDRVQVENIKRWRIEDQKAALAMTPEQANMQGQMGAIARNQSAGQIRGAALGSLYKTPLQS